MIIKCECGEKIDLSTQAMIFWYLDGGSITCKKCGSLNYFKKEK